MGAYEYALGPIAWILTDGLRQIGGRCATALFGNGAALLADGTRAAARSSPGSAPAAAPRSPATRSSSSADHLEMTNPRRPRFVYVLSDGGWADTQAGVERIRWLAEHGVPTIHLSHRDRAAVGRVRPHHRDHRPRPGARPHRRRHRRRAPRRRDRAPRSPAPPGRQSPVTKGTSRVTAPNPALLPAPPLFDVTDHRQTRRRGQHRARRARAPRARAQRAPRDLRRRHRPPRRDADARPASSSRCIGHRPDAAGPVTVYDGQRRYLAAQASHELAGTEATKASPPVRSLIVLLLDHEPTADEIRRIQAQANKREDSQPRRPAGAVRRLLAGPRRAARRRTGSPPSAPTSASAPRRPTTSAASSPSPSRSAPASPSAQPATSSR